VAEAAIEERQLLKSLRWYDGFVICALQSGVPHRIARSRSGARRLGCHDTVGHLGDHRSALELDLLETAAMFPNQSGGISLYAHEGWRRYFSLVGPIATFGYWIGWSVVLSIFGKLIGDLVVSSGSRDRRATSTSASATTTSARRTRSRSV
jgi:hypothetical protein